MSNTPTIKFDAGLETFNLEFVDKGVVVPISFNPYDPNLITRFVSSRDKAIEMIQKLPNGLNLRPDGSVDESSEAVEEAAKYVSDVEAAVKNLVDEIFQNDISDVIFRYCHPLSFNAQGVTSFERFMNAVFPVIKERCDAAQRESAKRIGEHTGKYKGKK
ncbi:MAG: hypothetical protein Q4A45_03360 [Clostridia bacterium]|nr:hypothetical protein [Clostridia bacterium]